MKNLAYAVMHAFGNGVGKDHGGDNFEDVACNGVRVPATPSGGSGLPTGGGVFVVTFTQDFESGNITADKSFAEIRQAVEAGAFVVGCKGADMSPLGVSGYAAEQYHLAKFADTNMFSTAIFTSGCIGGVDSDSFVETTQIAMEADGTCTPSTNKLAVYMA